MSDSLIPTADRSTPLNILIVDDSAMMRAMISRSATMTGLPIGKIFAAGNGKEALAVLNEQHVDALFTDINMPVMTGIELLREIAGQERWQNMVRVVISTDGSGARREEAGALDVQFYVEKPFRPEAMRDVLASLTGAKAP